MKMKKMIKNDQRNDKCNDNQNDKKWKNALNNSNV